MINIENELFTEVANTLRDKYKNIFITGEYVNAPSSFPCVSVIETDNYTYEKSLTDSGENHAIVMYEVNVYSNKSKGKKSECKEIMSLIDDIFIKYNFKRTMLNTITNINDNSIYRLVGRYRAVVSKDKVIYRG